MVQTLLEFLLASLLLTISPGPDIIYVFTLSLSRGFKSGFLLSCGLVSGVLVHTTLVAFGVSSIIKASESIYLFIKLLGVIYLLYLAYKVYKSPSELPINYDVKSKKQNLFIQGFIMNVLNPKVTLFFLAFFPVFLWNLESGKIFQFYTLGFIFMVQALVIFSLVAFVCKWLNAKMLDFNNAGLFFKNLQLIVFILIAVYIVVTHEY